MDLPMSRRIVVTPQQTGKFSVYSQVNWNDLTVRIGQVENGCWVDMGPVQFAYKDGYINFDVLPNMVNAMVIIGVKGNVESMGVDGLGYQVANMLVNGGARGCITAEQNGGHMMLYGARAQGDQSNDPSDGDIVLTPDHGNQTHNAFVWVFLGVCAVIITGITIVTEKVKKRSSK
jgi:hypothetical protein